MFFLNTKYWPINKKRVDRKINSITIVKPSIPKVAKIGPITFIKTAKMLIIETAKNNLRPWFDVKYTDEKNEIIIKGTSEIAVIVDRFVNFEINGIQTTTGIIKNHHFLILFQKNTSIDLAYNTLLDVVELIFCKRYKLNIDTGIVHIAMYENSAVISPYPEGLIYVLLKK